MGNYISFPDDGADRTVSKLVMNLVDPATDAGSIARLVASSLGTLDSETAANIDSDPLIDYRSQRPWVNFQDGSLKGMWREGLALSLVKDVEGQEFLRLHGAEPDFHWDSLVADMLDVVERFGVESIYSFTAMGAPTPHTRAADMIVRSSEPDENPDTLEANFWFQASFADYLEYHASRLGIPMTNVAVRVPVYLSGHHYSAGAVGALSMVGQMSGLRFPIGDLQHDVARQNEHLAELTEQNQELGQIIQAFENDYDEKGVTPGFVTAPDMDVSVPSVDEIGRAAEQFLAQVDSANERDHVSNEFDPQGLARRIDEIRRQRSWRADQSSRSGDMPPRGWNAGASRQAKATGGTEPEETGDSAGTEDFAGNSDSAGPAGGAETQEGVGTAGNQEGAGNTDSASNQSTVGGAGFASGVESGSASGVESGFASGAESGSASGVEPDSASGAEPAEDTCSAEGAGREGRPEPTGDAFPEGHGAEGLSEDSGERHGIETERVDDEDTGTDRPRKWPRWGRHSWGGGRS